MTLPVVSDMMAQIGWGLVGGLVAGILGGMLFKWADGRGWISDEWRQIVPLAVTLVAYGLALALGGSAFIAAFVAGIAFGSASGIRGSVVTLLAEETGELLAAVTWIRFGAFALLLVGPAITWQVILYAALCLTLVRMVPVAVAFAGQGVRLPTVAFIGWFGPRGLASLVFALIALERGIPDGAVVFATVTVTVALSVVLHGLTSVPLVSAYHRWYGAHTARHPAAEEGMPTRVPRRGCQLPPADPADRCGVRSSAEPAVSTDPGGSGRRPRPQRRQHRQGREVLALAQVRFDENPLVVLGRLPPAGGDHGFVDERNGRGRLRGREPVACHLTRDVVADRGQMEP